MNFRLLIWGVNLTLTLIIRYISDFIIYYHWLINWLIIDSKNDLIYSRICSYLVNIMFHSSIYESMRNNHLSSYKSYNISNIITNIVRLWVKLNILYLYKIIQLNSFNIFLSKYYHDYLGKEKINISSTWRWPFSN